MLRRHRATFVIVRTLRRVIVEKRRLRRETSATVIQKFWRGYKSRILMKEKWLEITKQLAAIRERLEQATAAADPKDWIGARTDSAIDHLFRIRDVAELICAVKTLDIATRNGQF